MKKLLAALLVICGISQASSSSDKFQLSGVVVDGRTKTAAPGVLVTVTPAERENGETLAMVTGADGRFVFTGVSRGKYSLSARRRNEQPQRYLQHDGYSTAIVVGPQLDSEHVVFPLSELCRLTGRVTDQDNERVGGAQVLLLQRTTEDGTLLTTHAGQVNTTASGEFHFAHLKPGVYFLAVSAQPWFAERRGMFGNRHFLGTIDGAVTDAQVTRPQTPPELDVAYPVTYSGDGTDPAGAQPIKLAEGVTQTEDIHLQAVPSVHILIPQSETQGGAGVVVTAVGPGGEPIWIGAKQEQAPGGYELSGLAPGHYAGAVMDFSSVKDGSPSVQQAFEIQGSAATMNLPTPRLSATLNFENGKAPDHPGLLIASGSQRLSFQQQPDGSFSLLPFMSSAPMRSGELSLLNAPGFVVKSISGKGVKSKGSHFELGENASEEIKLTVVAGQAAVANLDGVAWKDGKPVPAAMVLLIPEDFSNASAFRRDQSDSDGTFTLHDVPAGRYTLVAIDGAADLAYRDANVMKSYLAAGRAITLPLPEAQPSPTPLKIDVVPMATEEHP